MKIFEKSEKQKQNELNLLKEFIKPDLSNPERQVLLDKVIHNEPLIDRESHYTHDEGVLTSETNFNAELGLDKYYQIQRTRLFK